MARGRLGHLLELAGDLGLAAAAFAGPAAAMVLPRLPQLGLPALSPAGLRLAYRSRWASVGAAAAAFGLLSRRRRGPEQRAALALDGAALAGMVALGPRLYRSDLALTEVRGLSHLAGAAASALLHDDAQVAGAYLHGRAVAYPVALLSRARPFADDIGGVSVVPLVDRGTHAALALISGLDGPPLDLVRLGAADEAVVLYDRTGRNAFRPLVGYVEAGPDHGAALPVRPLLRCTWRAWRTLHPETELAWWRAAPAHALLHALGDRELTVRHVPEHPLSRPLDGRLPAAERVFALAWSGTPHAFTRAFLKKRQVVGLQLGERPVVVFYDPALDAAQAFHAELDRRPLALRPFRGLHAVAQDEDENLWDLAGRCIKGQAYGRHLAPISLSVDGVFWFAWARFHPHTGLDAWPQPFARPARAAEGAPPI